MCTRFWVWGSGFTQRGPLSTDMVQSRVFHEFGVASIVWASIPFLATQDPLSSGSGIWNFECQVQDLAFRVSGS